MLVSFFSRLLSSLLVAVLSSAIITTVLNQTVLNSHYLEGRLTTTDSYNRLSGALSAQVVSSAGVADSALKAQVQTILTPDLVKQKLNGALDQLQAYYRSGGAIPTIDFTDLAAQAQAAGIPLGQNSGLTKPIVLGSSSSNAGNIGKTFGTIRTSSIITSAVLALALLAVCWKRHRYTPLANVLISVGVLLALVALVFVLAPNLIIHFVKFGSTSNAFAALGHDLADSIASDLAKRFGIIAAVLVAAGIVARIILSRLRPKQIAQPVVRV